MQPRSLCRGDRAPHGQRGDAGRRAGFRDAGAQRLQPRGGDQRHQPVQLEVGAGAGAGFVIGEAAPQRQPDAEARILRRQHRRPGGFGGQHRDRLRPQRPGRPGVAPSGTEVEEDVGEQQRRPAAPARPQPQLVAPLRPRLPPQRVHRHHASRTQREAGGVQGAAEPLRHDPEPGIHRAVVRIRVVVQQEAIVLVGPQQRFAAAEAAHQQQGEGHRRRRRLLGDGAHQDAAVEVGVDPAGQRDDLGRGQPFGQQRGGQARLGALHRRVVAGQAVELREQPARGRFQRVGAVQHAGGAAGGIQQRQVAQPVRAQQGDGAPEPVGCRAGDDRRGHGGRERRPRRQAEGDPAGDVLLGQDADRAAVAVDGEHGGGARRLHRSQRRRERRIGRQGG
jgi:hypothetical protein